MVANFFWTGFSYGAGIAGFIAGVLIMGLLGLIAAKLLFLFFRGI